MEYTSRLSSCLVLVTILVLSSSPYSASLPRRLLQSCLAQQFVVPHSHLRALHGVQPLRWSSELANHAASLAEQRKADCSLTPSGGQYGENMFRGSGAHAQPNDAVAAWAEEAEHYDYGSNSCAPGSGCAHYKQMVWQGSTQVGCARVECLSGDTLMVCHYEPQGNVMGQKPF